MSFYKVQTAIPVATICDAFSIVRTGDFDIADDAKLAATVEAIDRLCDAVLESPPGAPGRDEVDSALAAVAAAGMRSLLYRAQVVRMQRAAIAGAARH
jgi:hypothetical protein